LTETIYAGLTAFAALGSAIIGGVFFAFSNFIMKALERIPTPAGIAAMQDINVTVLNLGFMLFFMGTAFVSVALGVNAVVHWPQAGAIYALGGGLVYVVGCFLVTIVFNAPRNNRLAKVDPLSEEGARVWKDYVKSWTMWNHVRTVACLIAAVLFVLALV